MKKAAEFEKAGKYLHAIQIYNRLIIRHPEFIDPHIKLAVLYEKTGKIDAVKEVYKNGLKFHRSSVALSLSCGQFYFRNKLWNDALEVLKNISPDDEPLVSLLMAYAYFNLQEYEFSKVHLLRFIICDEPPELIHEAYLFLAKIEYNFKNYEAALKYIRKAELLLYDSWEVHFVKAKVLYNLKMYSNAASAVNRAKKLNSNEPELHSLAGKIFIECKEFEKAESHLKIFMQSQKSVSSEFYLTLADAYQKQNKFLEAGKLINEALLLDPGNLEISKRKGILTQLINSITASDA